MDRRAGARCVAMEDCSDTAPPVDRSSAAAGGRLAAAGRPADTLKVPPIRCRRLRAAVLPLALVALLTLAPGASAAWFAADSVFNAPVAGAALDPNSPQLVAQLASAAAQHASIQTTSYSTPVYTVPADQPPVRVQLDQASAPALQAALAAVPVPLNAKPSQGTDGNVVVWQPATDTMWEFWRFRSALDGFHAAWAGRIAGVSTSPGFMRDLKAPDGSWLERRFWGVTATKLAKAGGLIRARELASGTIDHALAISIPNPRAAMWAAPAEATDGTGGPTAVPEGAHFRLRPGLNLDRLDLPPVTRTLAEAAQKYGIIVNNGGAAVAFYAETPTGNYNPYPALFGGVRPYALAKAFPWKDLQLLKMDLWTKAGPVGG